MSIDQSNKSSYDGVLLKMGRSVDFINMNNQSKRGTVNSKKSMNNSNYPHNKIDNYWFFY